MQRERNAKKKEKKRERKVKKGERKKKNNTKVERNKERMGEKGKDSERVSSCSSSAFQLLVCRTETDGQRAESLKERRRSNVAMGDSSGLGTLLSKKSHPRDHMANHGIQHGGENSTLTISPFVKELSTLPELVMAI